ncbi:MAG: diadenylate cyclase CdaA [Myxococcota bacterium]
MQRLLDILQVTSWIEVPLVLMDMVIVYYIIYRVLLLIRGTRAAQMLLGLLALLLLFFMSAPAAIDLRMTNWLLDKIIVNLFIIVIILFQDDIRRALTQAGVQTRVFSLNRRLAEASVLEEVIKAATMLSERQIGALIAVEREASLAEWAEEAPPVNADVTKELLFSIFLPEHRNPLHDGAALVQSGRITVAGAVLPLTNDTQVDKSLGTRHRAAIGLSEVTDAAVVVVSEETAQISLAHKGVLKRNLEVTQLREELQNVFRSSPEHERQRDATPLLDLFARLTPKRAASSAPDDDDEDGGDGRAPATGTS